MNVACLFVCRFSDMAHVSELSPLSAAQRTSAALRALF